jgi:hypothetical protein
MKTNKPTRPPINGPLLSPRKPLTLLIPCGSGSTKLYFRPTIWLTLGGLLGSKQLHASSSASHYRCRYERGVKSSLLGETFLAEVRPRNIGSRPHPRTVHRGALKALAKVRVRRRGSVREAADGVVVHLVQEQLRMLWSVR